MSSTNVPYVRGAQMVPTERQVEIPPKEAKKFNIIEGTESVEIPTETGTVKGNVLVSNKTGKNIMKIDTDKMKKDRTERAKKAPSKYRNNEKENDSIR